MNQETFKKIHKHRHYLKRIAVSRDLQNFELFDEPFKLALRVLDYPGLSNAELSQQLGINWQIIKQVRAALEV